MSDNAYLDDILVGCAAGAVPAPIAAMRLLMEAESPHIARAALDQALQNSRAEAIPRLQQVIDLISRHPDAWRLVHAVIGSVRHAEPEGDPIAHWAGLFDRIMQMSPEGSVALYSLGSPELLARATGEIVAVLDGWGLLGRERSVLDVGCGIGRLEMALAPYVGSVIGTDISPGMIAEARARCAGLMNVSFILTSGRDLADIDEESIDLITIVDAFPYILLSGADLAARHMAEATRILRPGGDLVILNCSYRGDIALDTADLAHLGSTVGLRLVRAGERLCRSWDAPAFHLVKDEDFRAR